MFAFGAALLLAGVLVPTAEADFGFKSLGLTFSNEDSSPATQAGSHPYAWTTGLLLNTTGVSPSQLPDGDLRDLRIQLPPGLVGTPGLSPRCRHEDFIAEVCTAETEVGSIELSTSDPEISGVELPLYNVEPLAGNAAELGFSVHGVPVAIALRIATAPPYNLIAEITRVSQVAAFFGSTLTIRGVLGEVPFLTLPRSCDPAPATFEADAWAAPGSWVSAPAPEPLTPTGCGTLEFRPTLSVQPTATAAHAPSGLDLNLDLPDEGLVSPGGTASADVAAATLALPAGMTINPALATGLAACTPTQLAAETPDPVEGQGCPQAAKIGTATVTTPLLDRPVKGDLYVAQPDNPATAAPGAENPFDSLLALYLVLRDPERGILITLPIRVDANPVSGRLTAGFEQIPELPLDHLTLLVKSGSRAPLTTPPGCARQVIAYSLTPSSGAAPVTGEESFAATSGCDTGFAPELSGGTTSRAAGSAATFVLDLRNGPGAPNLSAVHLTLPSGVAADLTAASTCPEGDLAAAACPIASRLGYARIALGTGPEPLWVPGASEPASDVYLAGPYDGGPFSLVVSVPAVGGPFDLGRIAVRAPLRIDADTGKASVEFADLPQIRDGIPLYYREIQLVLDRSGFIRNPTSCEPASIDLAATAVGGATATASARFQAADCSALGFRPRLALRFSGALGRNGHPRIDLAVRPRRGDANLRAATFDLPPGELLDTRRLGALCPRDLSAESCPVASRVGLVAISSPLLPEPLSGAVILHAPSGSYPDFAVEVSGDGLHLRIHGRVGSAPGGRLRIRLEGLPDIALSKASISLAGGRRGIVVNSASLCTRPRRAAALLVGQNGKEHRLRPELRLQGRC